jgi:hypothetical protein
MEIVVPPEPSVADLIVADTLRGDLPSAHRRMLDAGVTGVSFDVLSTMASAVGGDWDLAHRMLRGALTCDPSMC